MKPLLFLLAAVSLVGAEPGLKLNKSVLGSLQQDAQDPPAEPPRGQDAKELPQPKAPDNWMEEASFEKILDELLERLRLEDELAERENIYAKQLYPLLQSEYRLARKHLPGRLDKTGDAELQGRIQQAMRDVPIFKLRLTLKGKAQQGEFLDIAAEIRNVDGQPRWVARSIDGSDEDVQDGETSRRPLRYPHYKVSIVGPDGKPVALVPMKRGPLIMALLASDFKELASEGKAGDRFDPFGEGSHSNQFLHRWTPKAPGRHRLTLKVDYTSAKLDEWNGQDLSRMDKTIGGRFAAVPNVAFSDTIEFDVAPKH